MPLATRCRLNCTVRQPSNEARATTCCPPAHQPLVARSAALKHEFARAAAAAATAASIQQQDAPQLPACARWPAVLPRLPSLWSGDASNRAAITYRELLIACSPELHTKCTGGGWHDRQHLQGSTAKLPFADGSFDELHWCAAKDATTCAAGGPDACIRDSESQPPHLGWSEVLRVLRPTALVQVDALLPAPPLARFHQIELKECGGPCCGGIVPHRLYQVHPS